MSVIVLSFLLFTDEGNSFSRMVTYWPFLQEVLGKLCFLMNITL